MNLCCAQSAKPLLLLGLALLGVRPAWLPAQQAREYSGEGLAEHQRLAREAEERQDFTTAIKEYKALVGAVPSSAQLRSNLGVALYFHRDYGLADAAFRRALALKPDLYAPHLFLGLSLAQQGQPDAAVPELEKAVALNAVDPVAQAWLGYQYTAQARFEKAAAALEAAARLNPGDQDVWFALGRSYVELGKVTTTQLIERMPDGGRVWQLAGEQSEAQGNRSNALKLYTAALERRPDLDALRGKVQALGGSVPAPKPEPEKDAREEDALYARVQEYEQKARGAFEQISRIDPDGYRAHQVLGDAAAAADQNDEAIREYSRVLERKPDLPGIHRVLCAAYSHVAKVKDAVRECEAELALSPASADAYAEAARVYLLTDDFDRAQALLEKAESLDRPPTGVYKSLGKLYLGRGKYHEAVEVLNKYTAAEPRDVTAYYLLARALRAAGDGTGANRAIAEYRRRSSAARTTNDAEKALGAGQGQGTDENPQKGSNVL